MVKVVQVNKRGNRIVSYLITDGRSKREVTKQQLADMIEQKTVLNATKQEYSGKTIIRIKENTDVNVNKQVTEKAKTAKTAKAAKAKAAKATPNKRKIIVTPDNVEIDGEKLVKFNYGYIPSGKYSAYVYEDVLAKSDRYFAIAIHDCNPCCYTYLDRVLVVDLNTLNIRHVHVYKVLDNATNNEYERPSRLEIKEEIITIYNMGGRPTIEIDARILFSPRLAKGACVTPKLDTNKPSTWFNYSIVEDNDIIISLRKEIERKELLRLPGFDMNYDTFKFAGPIFKYGQSEFYMIDATTGKGWSVSYGERTTMTSKEVWKKRDTLLNFIREEVPTYIKIGELAGVKKL